MLALALAPALGALLLLQARWLGELADAQHEVTKRALETAAARIASDSQAALAEVQEAVLEDRVASDPLASALVEEVIELAAAEPPPPRPAAFVTTGGRGARALVVLDPQALQQRLFPSLARAALGADGLEIYRVAIVSASGDGPSLYRSHDGEASETTPPDASAELRLTPNRWRALFAGDDFSWTEVDRPVWVAEGGSLGEIEAELGPAPWRIEVRHRTGSLAAALEGARLRNLLLTAGLLALIVAASIAVLTAELRARRLAEKELAFVAGVSHELRTPLAVMRTAASNLRRGIVRDHERVAEYGALVERETTRLGAQVERVLRFADREASLTLEELDTEGVLRAAVERCAPWRDRKRFETEIDVAADARTVVADAAALTSAVHNLVENAIKYGDEGQTVRVTARRDGGLVVEVADEGPGIPARERRRLFEPFYRGATARAGIPGSGLGLGVASGIARAHGGTLELLPTAPGERGSTFALRLPPSNGASA